jgi:hypothetical protein
LVLFQDDVAFLMYNDETPDGTEHFGRAHQKGMLQKFKKIQAQAKIWQGATRALSNLMIRNFFPGVVAFDDKQGFWLVHSVPKFPPKAKYGFGYPESGHRYGQMFLCISLNGSHFNAIGELYTEGSKSNIPLLRAPRAAYRCTQHLRRADVTRIRLESGAQ